VDTFVFLLVVLLLLVVVLLLVAAAIVAFVMLVFATFPMSPTSLMSLLLWRKPTTSVVWETKTTVGWFLLFHPSSNLPDIFVVVVVVVAVVDRL
jgi:hypothetical protein